MDEQRPDLHNPAFGVQPAESFVKMGDDSDSSSSSSDNESSPPGKIGYFCKNLRERPHCLSLVLNLLVLVFFVLMILDFTGGELNIWPEVLFFTSYIAYASEAGCCANSRKYLSNMLTTEGVHHHISAVRGAAPAIWMHISCYHYETRTRQVSHTDSNGHTSYRTETYQERVQTYSETQHFQYRSWQDGSGTLVGLERFEMSKISFSKTWNLADEATENAFEQQSSALRTKGSFIDTHCDYSQGMELEGFRSKALALVDPSAKPCWLSVGWYYLFSLCFLSSWLYRIAFDAVSLRCTFRYTKDVSIFEGLSGPTSPIYLPVKTTGTPSGPGGGVQPVPQAAPPTMQGGLQQAQMAQQQQAQMMQLQQQMLAQMNPAQQQQMAMMAQMSPEQQQQYLLQQQYQMAQQMQQQQQYQ